MNRKEKKDQTNNVIQIKIKNNLLNKIYYYFFNKLKFIIKLNIKNT